jgi:AraC family transcriptional regulator
MSAWLDRHQLRSHISTSYGLCLDPPDSVKSHACRYDACVEVPAEYQAIQTDGIAFQMLPGGAFARVRHVGPYPTVRSSIVQVRDGWLAQQPRLLADRRRPLLVIFLDDPNVRAPDRLRSDVCVPVRTHHEEAFARSKFSETAVLAT